MRSRGLLYLDTVHVFPTMAESIKLAATSFRKDLDKLNAVPSNQSEVSRDMSHYGPMRLVGFSDKPTLYRMILPQRGDVYVKCGADILLNGLKTDLKAEARCPVCGRVTRFHIDQRRIEDLSPKDPTLHVLELQMAPGHLSVECESTHIFDRKDCLAKWLSTYTGKTGLVISLPEYMGYLNQRLPGKMS